MYSITFMFFVMHVETKQVHVFVKVLQQSKKLDD